MATEPEEEEFLPPYVTVEEANLDMSLESASIVLSVISSLVVIAVYTGYMENRR